VAGAVAGAQQGEQMKQPMTIARVGLAPPKPLPDELDRLAVQLDRSIVVASRKAILPWKAR